MFPSIDNGDFSAVPEIIPPLRNISLTLNKLMTLLIIFGVTRRRTSRVVIDLFDKLSAISKEVVEPFLSTDDGTGPLLPFLIDFRLSWKFSIYFASGQNYILVSVDRSSRSLFLWFLASFFEFLRVSVYVPDIQSFVS